MPLEKGQMPITTALANDMPCPVSQADRGPYAGQSIHKKYIQVMGVSKDQTSDTSIKGPLSLDQLLRILFTFPGLSAFGLLQQDNGY